MISISFIILLLVPFLLLPLFINAAPLNPSSAVSADHLSSSSPSSIDLDCNQLDKDGAFDEYIISNAFGLSLTIIPFGATLTRVNLIDNNGVSRDLVAGYPFGHNYCDSSIHPYFGATIGRVSNRIANCKLPFQGKIYQLNCNENINTTYPDTLHGGIIGYDRRPWSVISTSSSSISLRLISLNGEQGFPGDLDIVVTYSVDIFSNTFNIDYQASASTDSVVALTSHTYWNLDGWAPGYESILNHSLVLTSSNYLEIDEHLIPTGSILNVPSSMDFRKEQNIGDMIENNNLSGYDNAFVLDNWDKSVQLRATLKGGYTGISMKMYTDQPSIQFYSGQYLDGSLIRKADQIYPQSDGQYYEKFAALAIEAQSFPDAPNHNNFPSIEIKAGQIYKQKTSYAFTVEKKKE